MAFFFRAWVGGWVGGGMGGWLRGTGEQLAPHQRFLYGTLRHLAWK